MLQKEPGRQWEGRPQAIQRSPPQDSPPPGVEITSHPLHLLLGKCVVFLQNDTVLNNTQNLLFLVVSKIKIKMQKCSLKQCIDLLFIYYETTSQTWLLPSFVLNGLRQSLQVSSLASAKKSLNGRRRREEAFDCPNSQQSASIKIWIVLS